jgi:hypothetical protein
MRFSIWRFDTSLNFSVECPYPHTYDAIIGPSKQTYQVTLPPDANFIIRIAHLQNPGHNWPYTSTVRLRSKPKETQLQPISHAHLGRKLKEDGMKQQETRYNWVLWLGSKSKSKSEKSDSKSKSDCDPSRPARRVMYLLFVSE